MGQMNDYEKKHLALLRGFLPECMVLLKKDGRFPLSEAGKLALYGSGARHTIKGGTGSGEVNSRFFVTVEEGLSKAGFTITTKAWLDAYDRILEKAHEDFVKEIKARAKKNHTLAILEGMGAVMAEPDYELPLDGEGDVAVYVLSRISGEGNDRVPVAGDIKLSNTEVRDILALNEKYKHFMLVLNVGGPVDLSPVHNVKNILVLSQLGVETGAALADVLLGKEAPSGKLATTWSAWEDYPAIGEFGDRDDTRYTEGVYVGYRYFDSVGKQALYPFGYGLSYTEFEISTTEAAVQTEGTMVTVHTKVKNIGAFSGKEVVQVYVSVPEGKLDQPYQTLAGFAKTGRLAPQEEECITVTFDMAELASYDEVGECYILEAGNYIVRVGNSSTETKVCGILALEKDTVTVKAKNCLGVTDFKDWKPDKSRRGEESISVDVPILPVATESFETKTVEYDRTYEIDDKIKSLSDEELVYLNIGAFDPKAGIASIIGNAGKSVAGAAGESTMVLREKGIPSMVMADGPAGVRICPQYYQDAKGIVQVGESLPATMMEFMPKIATWAMSLMQRKPMKDAVLHEQYATAIPIGTAVAQSWNLEAAKQCGDIVGAEMERFGVHLWLAPALNIHRSIRCGRNFEYFSEDPLISGKFAAALTNGVQKHPGRGVTIKHYAVNNQETNRYSNNSIVSERALRDIYLKGFGICVKEAGPHALMTSYNLMNGEHTAESRALTEDVLRCEYGYRGIVMTDWIVAMMVDKKSKHPATVPYKVAAAGGDVIMPGGSGDYKNVLAALKEGKLSREQLQINATRMYRMACKLNGK